MSDYPSFAVRVPRGFKPRFASIFRPAAGLPDGIFKHACCFPADELPDGMEHWLGADTGRGFKPAARERDGVRYCNASSRMAPLVVPGTGCSSSWNWWKHQLAQCDAMNLPRDFLFREMELRLLVQPFEWDRHIGGGGPFTMRMHGISLNLKAVQVVSPWDDQDIKKLLVDTRSAIQEGLTRA